MVTLQVTLQVTSYHASPIPPSQHFQPHLNMKSSTIWQCAALAGVVSAASDAYLWTIDAGNVKLSTNQVTSIDSYTAERILARRKGVTDSAYLDITDESVLSDLNQYGGWQQPLFGASPSEHPAKIFIRISGYDGG